MGSKLEAILKEKGINVTPTIADLQAEIEESVRCELIHRGFADYKGEYEKVTVNLASEETGGGGKKHTMTISYSGLSERTTDEDSKIFTEFTDQLGAIKTCGSFKAKEKIPNFSSEIAFTSYSLGDLLDALNRVISNPELRIENARFGQAR